MKYLVMAALCNHRVRTKDRYSWHCYAQNCPIINFKIKKMRTIKLIPTFQLETIYRIMLKRIAKGYNAEQLTFLIGAPAGHVEEIEGLQRPFYSSDDLERITLALEESNPQSLFPIVNDDGDLLVSVHKQNYAGKLIHTYWIFRCIVLHDSATKYATRSGAKYTSIPRERLPIIPLQSTPLC
jgi:hypothetical protein